MQAQEVWAKLVKMDTHPGLKKNSNGPGVQQAGRADAGHDLRVQQHAHADAALVAGNQLVQQRGASYLAEGDADGNACPAQVLGQRRLRCPLADPRADNPRLCRAMSLENVSRKRRNAA